MPCVVWGGNVVLFGNSFDEACRKPSPAENMVYTLIRHDGVMSMSSPDKAPLAVNCWNKTPA